jgi:hypothetical protein
MGSLLRAFKLFIKFMVLNIVNIDSVSQSESFLGDIYNKEI